MARDDWRYYDEAWDEEDEEQEAPPRPKQCPKCLRWQPREAAYCTWCGKVFEDR